MIPMTRAWMRSFFGVDFTWDELRDLGALAERPIETITVAEPWL